MILASGFCIPEPLLVHTGIKGRQVHPLIRFLHRSRVHEKCADLHKAFHHVFVPGWRSRCSQRSPSQKRFSWALHLKEQTLKEQITDGRVFFKMPFLPCPLGCGRFLSSCAQFNSATWFSSPGDASSSAAFSRRRWQRGTLLSCARRLLSSWQRMQSCRSLQPRWEMRQGFYSPYFIVPKKGSGFWPILDLRVLNRALHRLPFKMLTHKRMITCIRSTWRMCTFMFRSFCDTDRSYGLRLRVGHDSRVSSPSSSPCLPVSSRRS